MDADTEEYFKIALNRWFADSSLPVFTRFVLEDVSEHKLDKLIISLRKWEAHGYIKIIKPPLEAKIDEPCLEMLKRID